MSTSAIWECMTFTGGVNRLRLQRVRLLFRPRSFLTVRLSLRRLLLSSTKMEMLLRADLIFWSLQF